MSCNEAWCQAEDNKENMTKLEAAKSRDNQCESWEFTEVENWLREKFGKAITSMNTVVGEGSVLWSAWSLEENTYVAFYTKHLCNFFKRSPILSQNGNKQLDTLLNKRLSSYVSMECWLHPKLKPKAVIFLEVLSHQNYIEKAMERNQTHEVDTFLLHQICLSMAVMRWPDALCHPTVRNSKSVWPLRIWKSTTLTFCARTVIDWSMEQLSSNGLQISHQKKNHKTTVLSFSYKWLT